MKQKTHKYLLMTLLLCLVYSNKALAYVEYNGLFYNIISEFGRKVELISAKSANGSNNQYNTEKVSIPSSIVVDGVTFTVTSIGDRAFEWCGSLTSISIPSSVTSIGNYTFYQCRSLTSIILPNSLTSIGTFAFGNCSALTFVEIPNGVTSIRNSAFYQCSSLTSVTIPNSVTSIEEYAFSGCNELLEVICYAKSVPKAYHSFPDMSKTTLYVLKSSVYEYRTAWQSFGNIVSIYFVDNPRITFENNYLYLNCYVPDSKIYYTTDGTTPSPSKGKLYTRPVYIANSCKIKAYANCEGFYESGFVSFNIENCAAPVITNNADIITITSTIEGASIYYTIDGSEPTIESTLYTSPIQVSHNATIKAIAVKNGYLQSSISKFSVNWFKTSIPEFNVVDNKVVISCPTENSIIFYTTDGSNPSNTSLEYSSPISIKAGMIVKAIAYAKDLNPSDIATLDPENLRCIQPRFSAQGNVLTITSATDGASIYYTLNGDVPSTSSSKYWGAITVSKNLVIKAIAVKEGKLDSNVASYNVDWFKTSAPEFSIVDNKVALVCSTANSTIYYTTDNTTPSETSTKYISPIPLEAGMVVKAIAYAKDFNPSDVAICDVEDLRCILPVISVKDNVLTITSSIDGAVIYYTTDGTTPTTSSTKYANPVTLSRNCVVKAIAVKAGRTDSNVASFSVDWFQAAMPEFDIVDNKVVMVCSTVNSTIYYTTDGTTPSKASSKYTSPIPLTSGMIVKAIAYAKDFNPSDVAICDAENLRCIQPVISVKDNIMTMTSSIAGATIYYTTDGTDPTSKSSQYVSPVLFSHNCIIKAIAMKDGYYQSAISTFNIDWFQAEVPSFKLTGTSLTISCSTPGAEIYYAIGDVTPDKTCTRYVGPLTLTDNKVVKAIAYADHFNPSEIAIYTVNSFTCEPATMIYDGRYMTLSTTTASSSIYYTIDGSVPKNTSTKYTKPFDVKGITTVRSIVVRDNYNNSKESSYKTTYYYDGEIVSTSEAGTIANAFEWCGTDNIEKLTVNGNIDGSDILFISSLKSLRYLNMEEANVGGNAISTGAFADSKLVSVSLPKTLTSVGSGLFTGCDNLAAIVWNANMTLPSSALNGIRNPNLLLYVKLNSYAPSSVKNVVANGVADNIVLYDGKGNNNFYVPQAFTAKRIAYSHNYSQKTIIGKCAGWETIALPFDVQNITHSKNGGISPFAANDATAKPFWLYSLGDFGFTASAKIKANTPYIISMPNNEDYADEYILGGDVTFSAENVTVPTTSQSAVTKGEFRFIPTTMNVEQGAQIYAINKGMEYHSQQPGSMFVGDLRSVAPFEAYLTLSSQMAKANVISLTDLGFDDDATGIDIPTKKNGMKVWSTGATIYISTDKAKAVSIYSVSGTLVRTVELHEGVNAIKGITPGMYVVGQIKVSVK